MINLAETREVTIGSSLTSERVTQVIADWLTAKVGSPVEATPEGSVKLGSRFVYRIWGLTPRGLRKLPMRLTWHAIDNATGSRIWIELRSDEGKYLLRIYQHHLVYQRTFDMLSEELAALLT